MGTPSTRSRRTRTVRPPSAAPAVPMPRELWDAKTTPDIVTVPARTTLELEGQGAPEGEAFQQSIAAIYGVAYALKFARKKAGRRDFKIGPLAARWWTNEAGRHLLDAPREAWRWELRIAVPNDMRAAEVARAIADATAKKGGKLEENPQVAKLALATVPSERFGRVLHIGPYAKEGDSFARIIETVEGAGLKPGHAHVEVYLSDPRRTKPEKLKTELLLELAGAGS